MNTSKSVCREIQSKKLSPKCNPSRSQCNLTLKWIPRMILTESSRSHNTLLVITSNHYIKVITELEHRSYITVIRDASLVNQPSWLMKISTVYFCASSSVILGSYPASQTRTRSRVLELSIPQRRRGCFLVPGDPASRLNHVPEIRLHNQNSRKRLPRPSKICCEMFP